MLLMIARRRGIQGQKGTVSEKMCFAFPQEGEQFLSVYRSITSHTATSLSKEKAVRPLTTKVSCY